MGFINLDNLLAKLTPEEICKRVTTETLWARYAGKYPNQRFNVPSFLREGEKDTYPSGSLFYAASGELLLFDHAWHKTYNIFTYLRKAYPDKNFNEILQMINKDFNLGIGTLDNTKINFNNEMTPYVNTIKQDYNVIPGRNIPTFSTPTEIDINGFIKEDYSPELLTYFYPITKETLTLFEVKEITGYKLTTFNINEGRKEYIVNCPNKEIMFAYPNYSWFFKNDISEFVNKPSSYKICRPYNVNKWITNSTKYCVDGIKQLLYYEGLFNTVTIGKNFAEAVERQELLPDILENNLIQHPLISTIIKEIGGRYPASASSFKTCFVTKSRKDVMAFAELGYAAISWQAEYPKCPYYEVLKYLELWFNNTILSYDNDSTGINNANSFLAAEYLRMKELPLLFPTEYKDCFGMISSCGIEETKHYVDKFVETMNSLDKQIR